MYWRLILVSILGQMQYKVSFILNVTGQFVSTIIEMAAIWALFTRFGSLEHWKFEEVCLFYGIVNISFAIADGLSSGFDRFGTEYIRTGNFDRILVRPRGIVLQLLGHELALRRLGRLTQGFIVLVWAIVMLDLVLDPITFIYLMITIASGTCLFMALFVLQATLSFWSVESLEVMNTLTYGGVQTTQYPISIYEEWFRKFFTFVVPVACIAYFPILVLLGKQDPLGSSIVFQVLSPIAGFLFLAFAIALFRFVGVKHYTSTGS